MTGVIVLLVGVALAYTNSSVQANLAASDFNSAQQFMQSVGKSVDDVAWTVGRTDTIAYATRYGYARYLPSALNYTVYVKTVGSSSYQFFATYTVGVLMYQIPTFQYSILNGYYRPVLPTSSSTLTLSGTTAPIARIFNVERLGTTDGSFIRVVAAPDIRYVNATVSAGGSNVFYVKLFLPILAAGQFPNKVPSITVSGVSLGISTWDKVASLNVTVSFPSASQGFDATFFHFPSLYQIITPPTGYSDAVLEFYAGTVSASLGVS